MKLQEQKGTGLIEYILVVSLISLFSITAINQFGKNIVQSMNNSTTHLEVVGAISESPTAGDGMF